MANETPNLDRRTMLKTAAVVAAAGTTVAAVAACSESAGTGTPAGSTASSSAAGGVLGPVTDVPVGDTKIFTDQKVVVTCPAAGTFKAFSAVCTHQGCVVNAVKDGVITCPCHGSQFNAADGSVKNGPAAAPLPAVAVSARDGQLVLGA